MAPKAAPARKMTTTARMTFQVFTKGLRDGQRQRERCIRGQLRGCPGSDRAAIGGEVPNAGTEGEQNADQGASPEDGGPRLPSLRSGKLAQPSQDALFERVRHVISRLWGASRPQELFLQFDDIHRPKQTHAIQDRLHFPSLKDPFQTLSQFMAGAKSSVPTPTRQLVPPCGRFPPTRRRRYP